MATSIPRRDPKEDLRELDRLYAELSAGTIGIAQAIRGMRKISHLTQAQFAAHRGVSVQALKQIEQGKGNPTVETLNKIVSVFGLEVGLTPKRRPGQREAAVYTLKRTEKGLFQFALTAPGGEVLLSSERYATKAGALNGIEAMRKNASDEARYRRRRSVNDARYFVLTASNGEIIGTSDLYTSDSLMERALMLVRNVANGAKTRDLVPDSPSRGTKFELKKSTNNKFMFNLKAANGEVILTSEMYETKAGALTGIESVKLNSTMNERYDRKTSARGEPYFNLRAANGQVIGHSEMYSSASAMEYGIASVKKNGAAASIDDRTP